MTDHDQAAEAAFAAVQHGDEEAFAAWLALAEPLLWRAMRSFAAAVDVEGIVQEALLRMWRLAPTLKLTGPAASLRYVQRLARNLAIDESRRLRTTTLLEPEGMEEHPEVVSPEPSDPTTLAELQQAIDHCMDQLPRRPAQTLRSRLEHDPTHGDDRTLAALLRMTLNTFHKNLSRARTLLAECLDRAGHPLR